MDKPISFCAASDHCTEEKIKVLLVDDEIIEYTLMSEALDKDIFEIVRASNGKEGYKKFLEHRPKLVLLDVMMPEMNGFELCEKIRQHDFGRYVSILMITGLNDHESIDCAYNVGATDFIAKPINYLLLPHRLRYILRAKQNADDLQKSRSRLAKAQKIAKIGYWEIDVVSMLAYLSAEVCQLIGQDSMVRTAELDDFLSFLSQDNTKSTQHKIKKAIKCRSDFKIFCELKRSDQYTINIRLLGEYYKERETDKEKYSCILQDISERTQAEIQINHLSYYDKLTDLPNRIHLKRSLSKAITCAAKKGKRLALFLINLDNFSRINASLGYDAGDSLLVTIAQRLKDFFRGNGQTLLHELHEISSEKEKEYYFLAHLGGDDFVIILNEISKIDAAAVIARRLIQDIKDALIVDGKELYITSSVGISIYPDDGADVEHLLSQADAALSSAKEDGRNCYKFYQHSMNKKIVKRLTLETALQKGLEREQFELFFQPKITLDGNKVKGAEALIRWRHPEMGLVSPADFISVAESTGLIIPMSEWIIKKACQYLQQWDAQAFVLDTISINLSSLHLSRRGLSAKVEQFLAGKTPISAKRFDFEITETMLMNDIDTVLEELYQLRKLGASITIDDFGTGYSSLSYLKRLPIAKLKIDQSFIRDLTKDKDSATIVNTVIGLAHNLGLKVVAEGVEHEAQLSFLKERGCDEIQGYFYSRPLCADDFMQWVYVYRQARPLEKNVRIAVS